jgi:hypothetical protein
MGRVLEAVAPAAVKCGRAIVAAVDALSGEIDVTGEQQSGPFTFQGTQEYNRLFYFYSVKVTLSGGSRFGRWVVWLTVKSLLSKRKDPSAYAPLVDRQARYSQGFIAWSKPLNRAT